MEEGFSPKNGEILDYCAPKPRYPASNPFKLDYKVDISFNRIQKKTQTIRSRKVFINQF